MTDQPKEESLLKFPCDFTIKIVGAATDDFEIAALAIVRKHVPDMPDMVIQSRSSANGKYLALSVTIHATSKEQMDNIYQELSSSPHVLMAL